MQPPHGAPPPPYGGPPAPFGHPYGPAGYGYGYRPPAEPPPGETPAVWPYYVAYCIAMALMYLAVLGFGLFFLVAADTIPQSPGDPPNELMGVIMAVVCLPLFVLYAAAPLLPKKPWAWTYHLVMICFSLTSACCMLAGIPLLIYWVKPETKAMFGKS